MLASFVHLSSFLAQAATAAPSASPGGSPAGPQGPLGALGSFAPMILIGIIFYFVLIRPQQLRAKEQAKLLSSVKTGDEVVIAGLHGIVTNAREAGSKTVLVKFGDSLKVEVDRSAIGAVIRDESTSEAASAAPAVKVS